MPRKYTDAQKRHWLQLFEDGRSEAWIAKNPQKNAEKQKPCDVRTIRAAIQDSFRRNQIEVAEAQLIRASLQNHQDQLIETVKMITKLLGIPSVEGSSPIEGDPIWDVDDELSYQRLLMEHLDNSTLYDLQKWRDCYKDHFNARRLLKENVSQLMQEKIGLKFAEGGQQPPFLYPEGAYTLTLSVLNKLLPSSGKEFIEKPVVVPTFEREIRLDDKTGRVMLRNVIIVEAGGRGEKCYSGILEAVSELLDSGFAKDVSSTGQSLAKISTKLTRSLKELLLLGMVPGRCRYAVASGCPRNKMG